MVSHLPNTGLMGLTLYNLLLYACIFEAKRTQKLVEEYLKSKTRWRMDASYIVSTGFILFLHVFSHDHEQ